MIDKTFILIVIVFIFVGIFSYQRILAEKNSVPLLAKVLDMGGMAQYQEEDSVKQVERSYTYQYDMQQQLYDLGQKMEELRAQEKRLLDHRAQSLNAIINLSGQIEDHAQSFLSVINEERKMFYDQLDKIKQIQARIPRLSQLPDEPARQEFFNNLQSELTIIFEEVTGNPKEDIPELALILGEIQGILQGHEESLGLSCLGPDECVQQNLYRVQDRLENLMEEYVATPSINLNNLIESAGLVTHEYKFLKNNLEVLESTLDENAEHVQKSLGELTHVLVSVSQEDLRDFMEILSEILREQEIFFHNLTLHQQNVKEKNLKVNAQIEKLIGRLKRSPKVDFKMLTERYDNIEEQRKQLTRTFEEVSEVLMRIKRQKLEEGDKFVKKLSNDFAISDRKTANAAMLPQRDQREERAFYNRQTQKNLQDNRAGLIYTYGAETGESDLNAQVRQADYNADQRNGTVEVLHQTEGPARFYNVSEHMENARRQNKENQRRLKQLLQMY